MSRVVPPNWIGMFRTSTRPSPLRGSPPAPAGTETEPLSRSRALLVALVIVGLTAAWTLTVMASAADGFSGNAESANARFVVAGYQELLGRSPDTDGLDFHVGRLAAGGDRARQAFAYSLLFSTEGSRREVGRAYAELLSRAPDAPGSAYWTDHLRGHGVLDLRVLLMASQEYWQGSGGSDQAWVEALYLDILDRPSDPAGREYWLGRVAAGVPRPLVVAGLYLSDEALGNRVDTYYDETLDRAPTADERGDAIRTIRSRGERELRAQLWASDEAFEQYLQAALS